MSDLKDCPEFAVFMQEITKPLSGKTEVQKERIYLLPEGTKIERGIRYLRTGLYLGDQKKKRFEPSQVLAMCLKAEDFKKSVSFKGDDERVIRYLKGETLDLSDTEAENEKGWVLVCVDGYGLGWGKAAGGTLKTSIMQDGECSHELSIGSVSDTCRRRKSLPGETIPEKGTCPGGRYHRKAGKEKSTGERADHAKRKTSIL